MIRDWRTTLICAAAVAATPASAAPQRLTEHKVRVFVERQEALWQHRDFAGFFTLAAPEAVFTTERRAPNGSVTVERKTVEESRRSAEAAFATIESFTEKAVIDRVEIGPDGRTARVLGHEEAEVIRGAQRKRLCATTDQALVLRGGKILSLGQIDLARPCPEPQQRKAGA